MMTNKHVVKMIVESAQLLSTAHHVLDGDNAVKGIYKKTHANHPSAVWTRESIGNYMWLRDHALALLNEYGLRYHKLPSNHATFNVVMTLKNPPIHMANNFNLTPMRVAITNKAHVVDGDPIQSYRNYYIAEKLKDEYDIMRFRTILKNL
jgi:hypothetical protein